MAGCRDSTIGALSDPKQMERIIAEGKADVVYMARQLLADPFHPQKVMAGQEDRIVKCLRCYTCMAERPVTFTRRCAVNPLIGREIEGMEVMPARQSKKVMVVGAGVAGLKAAITAAQRGHQVILCEKTDKVGGILKSEQALPFKYEMYELGVVLERQAKDEGVEIRLNTTVTPDYVEKEGVDALILAVGSTPLVLRSPIAWLCLVVVLLVASVPYIWVWKARRWSWLRCATPWLPTATSASVPF